MPGQHVRLQDDGRCAFAKHIYEARLYPREGDERLSANKRSDSEGTGNPGRSKKLSAVEKTGRKQRSGDLGRALRTVYDDTLRENVPDDFLDLIGKLS